MLGGINAPGRGLNVKLGDVALPIAPSYHIEHVFLTGLIT